MESQRLLVTGSNGFVGLHFCSAYGGIPLLDAGGPVDLRDPLRVRAAIKILQPEAVLHLAAQSSVASSFKDPLETYAINFLGTLNLLEALNSMQFTGVFVYVSSADVYGQVAEEDLPIKESLPLLPRSPYAVSKVAAEALCYQWSQNTTFRVVVARPFNQIGPGHDRRFAIPDFARQISQIAQGLRPASLTTGNLEVTRDFTDVRDSVRALHLLLEHGLNGEAYNICSGRERSLRSIVEELLDLAGVKAELVTDRNRVRHAEQKRMVGDSSKIRIQLGWVPTTPMRTTLEDILKETESQQDV